MTKRLSLVLASVLFFASACGGADSADTSVGDDPPASFEIDGDQALMTGLIGPSTPDAVEDLLADHPDVTTIVLVDVPGSEDDQSNLVASRLIRQADIATHVPADGEIASGGVDFFLAGATRSYEPGAKFGVHSWSTGDAEEGFTAADLDQDDEQHDLFLDYYDEIGVDEDFYWFTLNAAPPESIHFMTEDELDTFDFAID